MISGSIVCLNMEDKFSFGKASGMHIYLPSPEWLNNHHL